MAAMPSPVAELLEAALVGELTVIDADGRPVTYPLIPLWDGERVYLTSSTLFSRKLEHIKANPHVSALDHRPGRGRRPDGRALIQGDARIIDDDPHGGWERLLPIWEAKEPSIVVFPEGSRRAAAVLRARPHRDHAATRPVLVRRSRRECADRDGDQSPGGRVMRTTPAARRRRPA